MLLLIDNYDSFTYNLYQAIACCYPDVLVVRNNKTSIKAITELRPKGIILSPGPGRPEAAGICIDLIRVLVAGEMPIIPLLGVCLGHQALTVALGGQVIPSQRICHGKSDRILHNGTELYQSLPSPFQAGRYHSLVAERETLPSSLLIEAENEDHVVMGIRHRELPLYGVQFHPESILTPEGDTLLQAFVMLCGSTVVCY
jgi:anthranilate synthase component 2